MIALATFKKGFSFVISLRELYMSNAPAFVNPTVLSLFNTSIFPIKKVAVSSFRASPASWLASTLFPVNLFFCTPSSSVIKDIPLVEFNLV